MPPRITRVRWEASNLPWGIDFNERDGTLRGAPEEVGDYVIPISVNTNYGNDKKNVFITVEEPPYSVYAKSSSLDTSSKAYKWSGGAEADSDEFRKISMPKAYRLVRLAVGFAAKTNIKSLDLPEDANNTSQWYVVGAGTAAQKYYYGDASHGVKVDNFTPKDYPQELPISNVTSVSAGSWGSTYLFGYWTNEQVFHGVKSGNGTLIGEVITEDVIKIPRGETMQGGYCYLTSDGNILTALTTSNYGDTGVAVRPEQVKKIITTAPTSSSTMDIAPFYITYSGELYQGTEKIDFPYGRIRDIFCRQGSPVSFFVVTEDSQLYARGSNTSYSLGFADSTATRTDFEFIGYYDVKKALMTNSGSVLLTNDGQLFHTGTAMNPSSPTITDTIGAAHQGFVQVFPNKTFHDILFVDKTLVATIED